MRLHRGRYHAREECSPAGIISLWVMGGGRAAVRGQPCLGKPTKRFFNRSSLQCHYRRHPSVQRGRLASVSGLCLSNRTRACLCGRQKKLRRYSESPVQNEPEPNPRSTRKKQSRGDRAAQVSSLRGSAAGRWRTKLKFDITLSLFRVLRRQRVCTLGTG